MKLQVLFEDNHLIIVNKPAGLATMGVSEDQESLWTIAKAYIKEKYQKPGNVYLGIVSRLDATVSGAVVFARTSKAAARLNEQFRSRAVRKIYWAIVEGMLTNREERLVDWVYKDERHQRMAISDEPRADAKQAVLTYRCLRMMPSGSLIEISLKTGRKHQIRIQFASRGHPIIGDARYGAIKRFAQGIALHARRLEFQHPVGKSLMDVTAPFPIAWKSVLRPSG